MFRLTDDSRWEDAVRSRRRELVDRFLGFDPGMTQLRNALHSTLALTIAVGLGYVFSETTGAMKIAGSGLPAALVAAQHHGALIIAMLLPGIIAMLDSTGVNDGSIRGRLISSAGLAATFFTAMTVGLVIAEHRLPLLVWLVIAPMVAVYIRRFPTRGFVLGVALFNGAFMAYFMHAEITFHDLGWVALEVLIGSVASVAVRLLVFRPDNARALRRMQRAWVARTHTVIERTWQLTVEGDERRQEHLEDSVQRNLVRLNESSLMFDAQLAQPDAVDGSAMVLHQRLFDQELAVSNIARFTIALTDRARTDAALAEIVRRDIQAILAALKDDDLVPAVAGAEALTGARTEDPTSGILLGRFARSVQDLAEAQRQWLEAGAGARAGDTPFVPAVQLMAGFLPGSGAISERAGGTPGRRSIDRAVLKPYVRSTVQIGVAATIAVIVGDMVDGARLYWALLATFLAFMATSNTGEQVRKAGFRLLGTAIGIVIGDGLVHLAHRNLVVSFVVIAVALFTGFYLVRVNYMFLVVGITVTMSQLYVQLNEFSWHLLSLRLAETAVGVGAVVVAVVLVFPLRPTRVLEAGIQGYLVALENLVAYSLSTISRLPEGYEARPPTRLDVRALDGAYQSLRIAAQPLRIGMFGHRATRLNEGLAVASAARYYARNLAAGVEYSDIDSTDGTDRAAAQLLASLRALRDRVGGGARVPYVRSAALFERAYRDGAEAGARRRPSLVIRDLTLLDGALARLARVEGMPVLDTDTAPTLPATPTPASAPRAGASRGTLSGR